MWLNFSTFWAEDVANEGQFMVTNLWNSEITPFQEARIAENPVLAAQAQAAIGMLDAYRNGQRTGARHELASGKHVQPSAFAASASAARRTAASMRG